MKTMTKLTAIIGFSFVVAGFANANSSVEPADNSVTSKICAVATKGSAVKLHRAIKDSGLSKHYVANSVTCNGTPLVDFVAQYGENPASVNDYITGGRYSTTEIVAQVNTRN
ncbi:DUF3718 domain-containing protein [Alteromonas aestuariivivens]|uniref:DUF3718 domain-containing protein n=1 Tax=Alteromonas aestuariivivens TaxID=1938339 RepID=A0A3D8MA29_9ALTE|nr:DUF3718 domain-containing protein [Alteromonas aestuariivivens]RDV26839.1 DUF3718 domain-containing protein [Alteromonas aestuariivivens]